MQHLFFPLSFTKNSHPSASNNDLSSSSLLLFLYLSISLVTAGSCHLPLQNKVVSSYILLSRHVLFFFQIFCLLHFHLCVTFPLSSLCDSLSILCLFLRCFTFLTCPCQLTLKDNLISNYYISLFFFNFVSLATLFHLSYLSILPGPDYLRLRSPCHLTLQDNIGSGYSNRILRLDQEVW